MSYCVFMSFTDFIEMPPLSMSFLEDGIVSAYRDIYPQYVRYTGNTRGWEKTFDRCVTRAFRYKNGAKEGGPKEFFDTIFPIEGIGMQTKTGKKTSQITIGRQSGTTVTDKTDGMYQKIIDESIKYGCVETILALINTCDLSAKIYKLANWNGEQLTLVGDFLSPKIMSGNKGTGFFMKTDTLIPVHTFSLPIVDFSERPLQINPNRTDVSTLPESEIIEIVRYAGSVADRTIRYIELTLPLGPKFGDKGLLFDHLLKRYLKENYIGFDYDEYELVDLSVNGKVMFQIKRNEVRQDWINYCRSSVEIADRIQSVRLRVEKGFIETNAKQYVMIESKVSKIFAYRLASLKTSVVNMHGSFLKEDACRSKGGKNGNQTQFKIDTIDLEII